MVSFSDGFSHASYRHLGKFNYENSNMKKSESKAIGTLIVFAIIASPFVWLYDQIGGTGILVIIGIVVGVYALSKWNGNKDIQKEQPMQRVKENSDRKMDNQKDEDLANFTITVKTSGSPYYRDNKSTNKEPGRWVPPNESIKIGKYTITKGLVYVGGVLKGLDEYSTESSLIDPTIPVDSSRPDYSGEEMGYWPTYLDISASSRAAYLEWLAGDRNDADENIGYVFLYFYGLERRLLVDRANGTVDNKELQVLFNEIKRLLKSIVLRK